MAPKLWRCYGGCLFFLRHLGGAVAADAGAGPEMSSQTDLGIDLGIDVSASLLARYKDTVDRGLIESDEGQLLVLRKLEKLRLALADYQPAPKPNGLSRVCSARAAKSLFFRGFISGARSGAAKRC